jgi:hypothetical protein
MLKCDEEYVSGAAKRDSHKNATRMAREIRGSTWTRIANLLNPRRRVRGTLFNE